MPIELQFQFRRYIEWAEDHKQLDEVGIFLRSLQEKGHFDQKAAVDFLIIGNQDAVGWLTWLQGDHAPRGDFTDHSCTTEHMDGHFKGESAARTQLALGAKRAAHQVGKLLADG